MNWFAAHGKAIRLALRRLGASPLNTLLSLLGIGIMLALPASGLLFLEQVATLGRGAAVTPQLTVFLAADAERAAARSIEARIRDRGEVSATQLLAREDTLARMRQLDGMAAAIAALPHNPFPDAVVVTPVTDDPALLEKLAQDIRSWRHVEHVQIDSDWAHRLAALVGLARNAVLLLAALFGIGLASITFNVIRLQALTCQAEVEVSRLLGATDAFIRRPFLWYGTLLGLLGGAAAWLAVTVAMLWLRAPVAALAALYKLDLALQLPATPHVLLLLGAAASLGWLGAALSMHRQLR